MAASDAPREAGYFEIARLHGLQREVLIAHTTYLTTFDRLQMCEPDDRTLKTFQTINICSSETDHKTRQNHLAARLYPDGAEYLIRRARADAELIVQAISLETLNFLSRDDIIARVDKYLAFEASAPWTKSGEPGAIFTEFSSGKQWKPLLMSTPQSTIQTSKAPPTKYIRFAPPEAAGEPLREILEQMPPLGDIQFSQPISPSDFGSFPENAVVTPLGTTVEISSDSDASMSPALTSPSPAPLELQTPADTSKRKGKASIPVGTNQPGTMWIMETGENDLGVVEAEGELLEQLRKLRSDMVAALILFNYWNEHSKDEKKVYELARKVDEKETKIAGHIVARLYAGAKGHNSVRSISTLARNDVRAILGPFVESGNKGLPELQELMYITRQTLQSAWADWKPMLAVEGTQPTVHRHTVAKSQS